MKKNSFILSKTIFLGLLIILIASIQSMSQIYYVSQSAAGDGSGSGYSNRMSVSSHNSETFAGGDTIVLCGQFTERLIVPCSGAFGNSIVYDGNASSYDASATNATFDFDITIIAANQGMIHCYNKSYLTIQNIDFIGYNPNWSDVGSNDIRAGIWLRGNDVITTGISVDNCTFEETVSGIWVMGASYGITITNNTFHNLCSTGVRFPGAGTTYHDYITIGGSQGNGNVFHNTGQWNSYEPLMVPGAIGQDKTKNLVISYNYIYCDENVDYGLTSLYCNEIQNALVEYNIIDNCWNTDNHRTAIDFKGDMSSSPEGPVIVRFNRVSRIYSDGGMHDGEVSQWYGSWGSSSGGIMAGYDMSGFYAYGNYIEDVGNGIGASISAEQSYASNGLNVEDIYFFSNIVNTTQTGGIFLSGTTTGTDKITGAYIFNNTLYNNCTYDWTLGQTYNPPLTGDYFPIRVSPIATQDGPYIKNNLIIDPRPGKTTDSDVDNPEYRVWSAKSTIYNEANYAIPPSDYNHYYSSLDPNSESLVVRYSGSTDYSLPWNSLSRPGYGGHDGVGNPMLNTLGDGDFRLTNNTISSVITGGCDMGDGNIATITVQGTGYDVPWDFALGSNTVFHPTDPDQIYIDAVSRDSEGWGKGAYAYTGLSVPFNLNATALSFTEIGLDWEYTGVSTIEFAIQRSTDGENFTSIDTVDMSQTSYQDTDLSSSTVYYYRVFAFDAQDRSAYSNYASAQPGIATPGNLEVTSFSFEWVDLQWVDNSVNEDGFVIQRSLDGITYNNIDTTDADITVYHDTTNITSPTEYYYRLFAYNSEGHSDYSNVVSIETGIHAPTTLLATPLSSSEINLSWEDNSLLETGFQIERSLDGTDFTLLETVDSDVVLYTDTELLASTTYYYRVFAFNADGQSDYSNIGSATTYSDTINQSDPLFSWNFETGNILLDEGYAQKNLTDNDNVTTGGTEPDPPGYGSVGAIFNGSTQYLSLSNADYGDRALNGTDTDGTIYIAFNSPVTGEMPYMWSKYTPTTGNRQLSISFNTGLLRFNYGYNNGESYKAIYMANLDPVGKDIIVALSMNTLSKKYIFIAKDLSSDTFYKVTESDSELPGTYSTGNTLMTIGSRSDGDVNRSFAGTIYWVRIYDETHTEEMIKTVMAGETSIHNPKVSDFHLSQNNPNPFRNYTKIAFNVSKPSTISLNIYNISGQLVKTLVNRKMDAGNYQVEWNGCDEYDRKMPAGVYYYCIKSENGFETKKMVLIK